MGIQGLQTSNGSVGVSESSYLTLLKEAITASLYPESSWMVIRKEHRKGIASFGITSFLKHSFLELLSSQNFVLVKKRPFDPKVRGNGEDWPMFGYSMIGHRRLENIEYCIRSALSSGIEGDFVECGVWRGGASIYARNVLNLLGAQDRTVWLADSFEGFPVQKQEDKLDPPLAGVSKMIGQLDEVKENFARFGLLGDNVKFLKGWFSDTLAGASADAEKSGAELVFETGVDAFGHGAEIVDQVVEVGHVDELQALDFAAPFGLGLVVAAKVAVDDG